MESLAEVRGLQEDNMALMRKAAGGTWKLDLHQPGRRAFAGAMQTLKMKDGKLKMD